MRWSYARDLQEEDATLQRPETSRRTGRRTRCHIQSHRRWKIKKDFRHFRHWTLRRRKNGFEGVRVRSEDQAARGCGFPCRNERSGRRSSGRLLGCAQRDYSSRRWQTPRGARPQGRPTRSLGPTSPFPRDLAPELDKRRRWGNPEVIKAPLEALPWHQNHFPWRTRWSRHCYFP